MNSTVIMGLVKEMVKNPRAAATRAMGYELSSKTLWTMVILLTVLASLMSSLVLHLVKVPDPNVAGMIQETAAHKAPIIFAFFQVVQTGFALVVLFYIGRLLGGTGRIEDILAVMVLFQLTAILLVIGTTVLGMILPALGTLSLFVFVGWSIWASITAVDTAHRMNSWGKAFAAVILSSVLTLFASAMVLAIVMPKPQLGGL